MFIIIGILVLILIISIIGFSKTDYDGEAKFAFMGVMAGILIPVAALFSMAWHMSSENLSGYVYQRGETLGYARYDLRFSQNAGKDNQPSFCVKAGSEQDEKMKQYLGEDKKVNVYVPTHHFRFVNNPWECSSFAELVEEN